MYGTSVWLPTSVELEQPSSGADPPFVFRRWMKVFLAPSHAGGTPPASTADAIFTLLFHMMASEESPPRAVCHR